MDTTQNPKGEGLFPDGTPTPIRTLEDITPELLRLYEVEKSPTHLAPLLGLTPYEITKHLKTLGVYEGRPKTQRSSLFEKYGERARILYEDVGLTFGAISRTLPISHSAVEAWAKRHFWTRKTEVLDGRSVRQRGGGLEEHLQYDAVKDRLPELAKTHVHHGRPSPTKIAKELGIKDVGVVTDYLTRSGLFVPRPTFKSHFPLLKDLYVERGYTVERAARELSITSETASRWLKEGGVEVIPSQYRRTPEEQEAIQRKISKTKYDPLYQERIRQENMKRWGRPWPNQQHLTMETVEVLSTPDTLREFLSSRERSTITLLSKELGCGYSTLEVRIKEFGLQDMVDWYISSPELEILELVKSWGLEAYKTRKVIPPYEIDIFIPSLNIGIEFNGDYWHRTLSPNHPELLANPTSPNLHYKYHQKKSLAAQEQGVFLYQIFEYEWVRDPSRVISHLKDLLLPTPSVYARKTEVREVDSQERREFLNLHHLQGQDAASSAYGLYYEDELLSLMSFTKPRFSKKYDFELSRFVTRQGTRVVGGASKLFSAFLKDHPSSSVVSYADIATGAGDLYPHLGFTFSHISDPNYVWVDGVSVLPRYQTQMKDEVGVMESRGFSRIFDCGNRVFTYVP